jgi:hypothetical protein
MQSLSSAPAAASSRNQYFWFQAHPPGRRTHALYVLSTGYDKDDFKNCEQPSEWDRDAESYLFTPVDVIAISPLTKPQDHIHHEPSAEKAHRKPDYTYGHEKYGPEPVHRLLILLH